MIDIHNHILYGIDDGSTSLEESLLLLKKMSEIGFKQIIMTPHYMEGTSYQASNKTKESLLHTLEESCKRENILVDLHLGNEVFVSENIKNYIDSGEIQTMNGTRYLLIEFPFHNAVPHVEGILEMLQAEGITPIVAHPERYVYFQKNPREMMSLIECGALFQCNFESIIGHYGKKAEETITYLLKHNMVHFLATDVHGSKSNLFKQFSTIKEKITKRIGENAFIELTRTNPMHVLMGEEIEIILPKTEERKDLLKRIFTHKKGL